MLPTRTNKLDTEEPTRIWHHWFNIRVRQYMILEIFFIISLIMILYRFQTISNQNDRVLEMVNSMHSRFGNIERKLESLISRIQNADINPFHNTEPLEQSIADELKSMEFPTQKSTDNMELIIIPQINQPTSKTAESTLKIPIQNEKFRFNAADFLRGATVDIARSSSFNLNPIIGFDQANIVLLDRPQPPADEARCTTDKNPVLTINLAKYIKPISVSYQHSKWNGTIPNGDPKTYDVVACLDFYCGKRKSLVSNCQYNQYELNATEQMCNISSNLNVPEIGKVQFRFRENYGGTKMTCVHLVRVYGETETPLKSGEMCTKLTRCYHDSYPEFTFKRQNCTGIYDNKCCSECPECCQECLTLCYERATSEENTEFAILSFVTFLIVSPVFIVFYIVINDCIQSSVKYWRGEHVSVWFPSLKR